MARPASCLLKTCSAQRTPNPACVVHERQYCTTTPAVAVLVLQAGGFVADGRVNGSLNLSRALGDMEYKQTKELGPDEQVGRCGSTRGQPECT